MDPQTDKRTASPLSSIRHANSYPSSKINYKQAVLSTLAFFDLFDYPLTEEETRDYLFQIQPDAHHVEITLKESNRIVKRGHYYQLAHHRDLASLRHEREIHSKHYWKKIDDFRKVFGLTPFLEGVFVCNTLAYNNADTDSDIDLLIVTRPDRLFTARLFITLWTQLFGIRRHGNKVAGRFCLSFFTTEDNLNLGPIRKGPLDIYMAYWLRTIQPVYGNPELYEKLQNENASWMGTFFQQPPKNERTHLKPAPEWTHRWKEWFEKILDGARGQKWEQKLRQWQMRRAREKRAQLGLSEEDSAVIIKAKMLKFHNTDRRESIDRAWIEKISALIKN